MKQFFTQVAMIALCSGLMAQNGVHIQEYTNSAYVYNKDSVYMPISFSTGYSRMAVVNPTTKHWDYLNTVSYNKHLGPFVMKNKMEGVMIYSSSQKVYKTTDGWKNLTEVPPVAAGFGLHQVAVTDEGYIGYESQKRDLFFSEKGDTWVLAFDGSSGINALRAKGKKVILYTGATDNYVSSDGGRNFTMIPFGTSISGNFVDLVLLSEDTFVYASSNRLYKSFDGGTTWTSSAFPGIVSSIAVKDTLEMYITTATQNYYTTDGGATWQTRSNTATGPAKFIGNDLYVFPNYRSSDQGVTWTYFLPKLLQNNTLFDLSFKGNDGLVAKAGGKVILSGDKGRSFSPDVALPTSEDIMAVQVLHNGDFIAGDRKSQVYYSTDKGKNWSNRYTNTFNYNAVKFSSSANDSIIVQTRLGQPLISTDHGTTFNFVTAGGGTHTQTVKPSGQIIDAGGWFDYSTFLYKGFEISVLSPSGSKTVIDTFLVNNANTESVSDMVVANNTVGYLMTYNTTSASTRIYKSVKGFEVASTLFKSAIPSFRGSRLHVLSPDTIVITGEGSNMYYLSNDGGATWKSSSLDVHAAFPSIYPSIKKAFFFEPDQSIFTLGNYGFYLNNIGSVTNPNNPTGIVSVTGNGPDMNEALQVYPNPAHSHIRLDVTQLTEARIFDHTGKLVMTCAASPEIHIASLPAGIYFIQATGKHTVRSGKFIKQ